MNASGKRIFEWVGVLVGLAILGSCGGVALLGSGLETVAGLSAGLLLAGVVVGGVFLLTRRPIWLSKVFEWAGAIVGLLILGSCMSMAVVGGGGPAPAVIGLFAAAVVVGVVYLLTRSPSRLRRALEWASLGVGLLVLGSCAAAAVVSDDPRFWLGIPLAALLVAFVYALTRSTARLAAKRRRQDEP